MEAIDVIIIKRILGLIKTQLKEDQRLVVSFTKNGYEFNVSYNKVGSDLTYTLEIIHNETVKYVVNFTGLGLTMDKVIDILRPNEKLAMIIYI